MTHYRQTAMKEEFESLSDQEKLKYDSAARKEIMAIGTDRKYTNEQLFEILTLTAPYLEDKKIVQSKQFCDDMATGMYLSLSFEREARDLGVTVAQFIAQLLVDSDKLTPEAKHWLLNNKKYFESERDNQDDNELMEQYADFCELFNIDNETLLKFVEDNEEIHERNFEEGEINAFTYSRALYLFLREKSFEEKSALLKTALARGYTTFAAGILDEIANDPEFIEHKEEFGKELAAILSSGSITNNDENQISDKSYGISYKGVLSKDAVISIAINLADSDKIDQADNQLFSLYEYKPIEDDSLNSLIRAVISSMDRSLQNLSTVSKKKVMQYSLLVGRINGLLAKPSAELTQALKNYTEETKEVVEKQQAEKNKKYLEQRQQEREEEERREASKKEENIQRVTKLIDSIIEKGITDLKNIKGEISLMDLKDELTKEDYEAYQSLSGAELFMLIVKRLQHYKEQQESENRNGSQNAPSQPIEESNNNESSEIEEDESKHQFRDNLIYMESTESARSTHTEPQKKTARTTERT